jgi:hypothetical protein
MMKDSFDENNHRRGKGFLIIIDWTDELPRIFVPIILSVEEEVAVHAGREVLVEVDDNSAQIVDDPKGIVDQEIRPHTIYFLIIIAIIILICHYAI